MNLKLIATVTSVLTSVLIVYFFFIIMKPNTNEKVIPMHLKNNDNEIDNEIDNELDNELDNKLDNELDKRIDRDVLYNIKPLSDNYEKCLPANEVKLENYKDLENSNTEKEFYTNDAPLFTKSEINNKKLEQIDLNSQHRRVNFY